MPRQCRPERPALNQKNDQNQKNQQGGQKNNQQQQQGNQNPGQNSGEDGKEQLNPEQIDALGLLNLLESEKPEQFKQLFKFRGDAQKKPPLKNW